MPEVIVGGICDEGSEAGGQGEEGLSNGGVPNLTRIFILFSNISYLEIEELRPLWCDVEHDSLHGAR